MSARMAAAFSPVPNVVTRQPSTSGRGIHQYGPVPLRLPCKQQQYARSTCSAHKEHVTASAQAGCNQAPAALACVDARQQPQHPHDTGGRATELLVPRRRFTAACMALGTMIVVDVAMRVAMPPHAHALACPGLGGYALQQCLREARKAREAQESEGGDGTGGVQEERLRSRQYEQPGTLVTLPSGIQYREILEGTGPEAAVGVICEICYIVYRLSSGAYYKYSSGGTPVFLFSLGYGQEGKDDVGQTYRFRLGDPQSLPAAVAPALLGMRQGGRRRILVPPQLGWVNDQVGPRPDTFGGQRRLIGHREEPLLFEAELVRVRPGQQQQQQAAGQRAQGQAAQQLQPPASEPGTPLFKLPAPPTYFKSDQIPQ